MNKETPLKHAQRNVAFFQAWIAQHRSEVITVIKRLSPYLDSVDQRTAVRPFDFLLYFLDETESPTVPYWLARYKPKTFYIAIKADLKNYRTYHGMEAAKTIEPYLTKWIAEL